MGTNIYYSGFLIRNALRIPPAASMSMAGVAPTITNSAPDVTAPTTPTITATQTGSTSVSIALTAASTDAVGVTGYELDWSPNGSSSWANLPGVTVAGSFPYTHTSLAPSTQYFYRCRSRDLAGNFSNYGSSNATTAAASGAVFERTITPASDPSDAFAKYDFVDSDNGAQYTFGIDCWNQSANGFGTHYGYFNSKNDWGIAASHQNLTPGAVKAYTSILRGWKPSENIRSSGDDLTVGILTTSITKLKISWGYSSPSTSTGSGSTASNRYNTLIDFHFTATATATSATPQTTSVMWQPRTIDTDGYYGGLASVAPQYVLGGITCRVLVDSRSWATGNTIQIWPVPWNDFLNFGYQDMEVDFAAVFADLRTLTFLPSDEYLNGYEVGVEPIAGGMHTTTRFWSAIQSEADIGTSGDTTAPTAGTYTATTNSSSQITIAQTTAPTDNVAVVQNDLERSPNGTTGWAQIFSNTTFPRQDNGLTGSTQYFYRVKHSDAAGNFSYSSTINNTTNAASGGAPGVPTNVEVTAFAQNSISVQCTAVAGATSYTWSRSTDNGGSWSDLATVTSAFYTDNTATGATAYVGDYLPGAPPTRYVYRVKANNGAGSSAYTTDVFFSVYRNGVQGWVYSLNFGATVTPNYASTGPDGNATVQHVSGSGWQPVSSGNSMFTNMPSNMFAYKILKVKPLSSGWNGFLNPVSVGDRFFHPGGVNMASNVTAPTPGVMTANVWNTVKISYADLLLVDVTGTASFAGGVMTVTSASANSLRRGMIIGATGLNSGCQIDTQTSGTTGGSGTYTLYNNTQTLSSRSIYASGTDQYKWYIDVPSNSAYLVDDVRDSRQ
jgi:hypothetical protein